jgi:hypothetical protein
VKLGKLDTSDDVELSQRSKLYQVFLKLYEHHQDLLDKILDLENSGSEVWAGAGFPFIQGLIQNHQIHLITNLVGGKTQALMQPEQVWTIGRDSRQVGLAVQDRRLSRCHAAIRYEAQNFYLVDLESSNGSFVNGKRIEQPQRLKDGDRLRLGSLTISFFFCNSNQNLGHLVGTMQTWLDRAAQSAARPKQDCEEIQPPALSGKTAADIYPPDKTLLLPRANLWEGKLPNPPNISPNA